MTVSAALAVREALDKAGFDKVAIILSSGFGDPAKVRAFVNAERVLGIRLFDSIGAGGSDCYTWRYAIDRYLGRGYRRNKL